jgi:hypothetical protein
LPSLSRRTGVCPSRWHKMSAVLQDFPFGDSHACLSAGGIRVGTDGGAQKRTEDVCKGILSLALGCSTLSRGVHTPRRCSANAVARRSQCGRITTQLNRICRQTPECRATYSKATAAEEQCALHSSCHPFGYKLRGEIIEPVDQRGSLLVFQSLNHLRINYLKRSNA